MKPHWSDHTIEFPIFSTVIEARGSAGNINTILFTAMSLLRRLGLEDRAALLMEDVRAARSYEEALGKVQRWFPVQVDDED